jgi:hypothetical protein
MEKKMIVYTFSRTLFQRKLETLLKELDAHPLEILSHAIGLA